MSLYLFFFFFYPIFIYFFFYSMYVFWYIFSELQRIASMNKKKQGATMCLNFEPGIWIPKVVLIKQNLFQKR